jgi:hypothetical protein
MGFPNAVAASRVVFNAKVRFGREAPQLRILGRSSQSGKIDGSVEILTLVRRVLLRERFSHADLISMARGGTTAVHDNFVNGETRNPLQRFLIILSPP